MKIDGQLKRMYKGENKENIKVLNVYKDSVEISFYRQKRMFLNKS